MNVPFIYLRKTVYDDNILVEHDEIYRVVADGDIELKKMEIVMYTNLSEIQSNDTNSIPHEKVIIKTAKIFYYNIKISLMQKESFKNRKIKR